MLQARVGETEVSDKKQIIIVGAKVTAYRLQLTQLKT